MTHPLTKPNEGAAAPAYQRLQRAVEEGAAKQDKLIAAIREMIIKDRLVHPRTGMTFVQGPLGVGLRIDYRNDLAPHTIHDHALQRLVKAAKYKIEHARYLLEPADEGEPPVWKSALLVDILNTSFKNINFGQKGDPRFLHRIVGSELRGFLSRQFNLHLASAPLLRAFVGSCAAAGAVPVDAKVTPVKFSLKCVIPEIFEPVPGEFVCVGVEWTNSDFGTGQMRVSLTLWRAKGGFTVLEKALARTHIGRVLHDSDLDNVEVSEATAKKEADAMSSYIADKVRNRLDPDYVGKVLSAITDAHQEQIGWDRLYGQFERLLTKRELEAVEKAQKERGGVEDLPPMQWDDVLGGIPTRWWASSVLAKLAGQADTVERAAELERASGAFLKVKEEE